MTGAELLNTWIAQQRANPPPATRWSLLAFAKDLGVTRTTINAWRRGEQLPIDEHATKLAELTNNAVPADSWRESTP